MGQQGDTGLAGYEVNTASLSLLFNHMWTQLDCCSCLTQHNCSNRAIRDPKVQWGPQDQKVKRYTSFISCVTQILSLALFLEYWSVLMFRSEQVWIYQQSEHSKATRCPQRIEISSVFVLLFVIFSLGWAGRWWQSWRSSWFPRWHSKSLLVHCLPFKKMHTFNSYYHTNICIVSSGSSRWQRRTRRTRRSRLQSMCLLDQNDRRILMSVFRTRD